MGTRAWWRLRGILAACLLLAGLGVSAAATPAASGGLDPLVAALLAVAERQGVAEPPETVAATVKEYFPKASLVTFGRKSLNGVPCYEVLLREADGDAAIQVAADGSVGSIRLQARIEDLPADEQARVAAAVPEGSVLGLDLRLRLGVARGGTFARLADPDAFYSVKYLDKKGMRVANVTADRADFEAALARSGAVLPGRPR